MTDEDILNGRALPIDRRDAYVQMHENMRAIFHAAVTWFTFFMALMMGAMSWAFTASFDTKGRLIRETPFLLIVGIFEIQMILGAIACWLVREDIQGIEAAASVLGSHIPKSYRRCMELMVITLVTNMLFWAIVLRLLPSFST